MTPHDPPGQRPDPRPPAADVERPANPTIERADEDEEPAFDEVEVIDQDEFGEPTAPPADDEDADEWDRTES
jgi:hypothetical protein